MTVASGTHQIGPKDGKLTLNTYREGMGAKIGHDLTLEATRWSGTANLDPGNPSASSVNVKVDARSLEILSASGGVKPLSDKDRKDIAKNIDDKVLQTGKFPEITFQSTGVTGGPSQLTISGTLTIVGNSQPATLDVSVQDTKVTAKTTIVQSQFGIKPFSAMLGALKVRDSIDLQVELTLPSA